MAEIISKEIQEEKLPDDIDIIVPVPLTSLISATSIAL